MNYVYTIILSILRLQWILLKVNTNFLGHPSCLPSSKLTTISHGNFHIFFLANTINTRWIFHTKRAPIDMFMFSRNPTNSHQLRLAWPSLTFHGMSSCTTDVHHVWSLIASPSCLVVPKTPLACRVPQIMLIIGSLKETKLPEIEVARRAHDGHMKSEKAFFQRSWFLSQGWFWPTGGFGCH